MFTGIVEFRGTVLAARPDAGEVDLAVDLGPLAAAARPGDSIALSGCCCTVTRLEGQGAWFRLSAETLARTWLGELEPGVALNLESAVRAGAPLGGHIVQGHVDAVGIVRRPVGPAGGTWTVSLPPRLLRYCVEKGSIALDGVSLTIAALSGSELSFAIIPLTAQVTTIGGRAAGAAVNVEVDILAKYVERLIRPPGLDSSSLPGT